jgi:hypothetical protein
LYQTGGIRQRRYCWYRHKPTHYGQQGQLVAFRLSYREVMPAGESCSRCAPYITDRIKTLSRILVLPNFSSSRILVLLSFSRPLVVPSSSRILGFSLMSSSCSLSHCHSPYQIHIQPSPAVQQVFSIHCCFNSRSLSVGYCCLLVATVTTASVSLACFCHIITDGGNTALRCFLIQVNSKSTGDNIYCGNTVVWSTGKYGTEALANNSCHTPDDASTCTLYLWC